MVDQLDLISKFEVLINRLLKRLSIYSLDAMFNLLVHFRVMHTCLQQRDQQSVVSALKIILVLPFLDHLLIDCFEHSGKDVFLTQAAISQDLAELN